jgi:aerobic-type carbon monoxide dehydrogenase small subunit (CoxS/CutS family)
LSPAQCRPEALREGLFLTLEGFSEFERETFADSFVAAGGLQCGFCTPGIVVRAKNLIDKNPDPSDDQINRITKHASLRGAPDT